MNSRYDSIRINAWMCCSRKIRTEFCPRCGAKRKEPDSEALSEDNLREAVKTLIADIWHRETIQINRAASEREQAERVRAKAAKEPDEDERLSLLNEAAHFEKIASGIAVEGLKKSSWRKAVEQLADRCGLFI